MFNLDAVVVVTIGVALQAMLVGMLMTSTTAPVSRRGRRPGAHHRRGERVVQLRGGGLWSGSPGSGEAARDGLYRPPGRSRAGDHPGVRVDAAGAGPGRGLGGADAPAGAAGRLGGPRSGTGTFVARGGSHRRGDREASGCAWLEVARAPLGVDRPDAACAVFQAGTLLVPAAGEQDDAQATNTDPQPAGAQPVAEPAAGETGAPFTGSAAIATGSYRCRYAWAMMLYP